MRRGSAVNPAEEEQKQSDRCRQSSGAREWTAAEHRFTSTRPGVDVAKRSSVRASSTIGAISFSFFFDISMIWLQQYWMSFDL